MRRSEKSAKDMFLGIDRNVATHIQGRVPELKRLIEPIMCMGRQKFQGVIVGAGILCKLQEPVLVSVVLWLDLEAKVTGQLLVTLKEMTYVLEVLAKLCRPLCKVSTLI